MNQTQIESPNSDTEFSVSNGFKEIRESFINSSDNMIQSEEVIEIQNKDINVIENIDDPLATFDAAFCEFPIAHLSTRLPKSVDKNKIRYTDSITGRNGNKIQRNWLIATASEHGLGGPSSIDLFYHIMQIWDEQGFENKRICLGTINNLLNRMGLNRSKKYYDRVRKDLDSLTSLKINSKNGYYDVENDKYLDIKLEIFQDMEVVKSDENKANGNSIIYLVVADRYHSIIKNKSQRSLLPFNDEFFNSLNAIEKKLALFLSKMFSPLKQKRMEFLRRFTDDLATQLPIVLPSPYKINEKLSITCKGLIEKGFPLLKEFEIEKSKKDKNRFVITFYNNVDFKVNNNLKCSNPPDEYDKVIHLINDTYDDFEGDYNLFYKKVANYVPFDIVYRCASESKADGDGSPALFTSILKRLAKEYLE